MLTGIAFSIDRVEVFNRNDIYSNRLAGASVLVDGQKCGTLNGTVAKQTVRCYLTVGRRVRVVSLVQQDNTSSSPLNLCEVQVYGEYNLYMGTWHVHTL